MQLTKTTADHLQQFARQHYQRIPNEMSTFEEGAQAWAELLFHEFSLGERGPIFGLVRVFRISRYEELTQDLQALVNPKESAFWMTLMGTCGLEDAWRDRHRSVGHKVFPAQSAATPMLKSAFEQIRHLRRFDPDAVRMQKVQERGTDTFFFVPDARGSDNIPAQEGFVRHYGIRSVIGFGTPFLGESGVLVLCFALVALSDEEARRLVSMSPFITTSLAKLNKPGGLWCAG